MFGFMRPRQKSVDPPADPGSASNQVDSNTTHARASSEPVLLIPDINDDDHGRRKQTSASIRPSARDRERFKNDFSDSGGLQSQTVEDLEKYAVYKAEETTNSVNNCLKIAENIREDAARTLDTLNQQGEQIERTHAMAVDIDKDLHKGEKLLNGLGGMFSKPWKPKKTREIKGPVITSGFLLIIHPRKVKTIRSRDKSWVWLLLKLSQEIRHLLLNQLMPYRKLSLRRQSKMMHFQILVISWVILKAWLLTWDPSLIDKIKLLIISVMMWMN